MTAMGYSEEEMRKWKSGEAPLEVSVDMSASGQDESVSCVFVTSTYARIAAEIGQLVTEKNAAYGDSFAQSHLVMEAFYPDGIRVDQYADMLAITRIVDKLFRIATRKDAFGESPYRDIAGYGILGAVNDSKKTPT